MEPDTKFDSLSEGQKNIVLEFASIMNIDDINVSLFYLEFSGFNLNVPKEKAFLYNNSLACY